MKSITSWTCFSILLCCAACTRADTFGSGPNTFDIEFVSIGKTENPADTTGDPNPGGKVEYVYRMGKYEISEDMINKANTLSGLGITHDNRGANKPATSVTWFEAALFINWLNTSTGHTPAYKFDDNGDFQLWEATDAGFNPNNRFRNNQARYVLPSADEWYKAAYYDPTNDVYYDYPTGSDASPSAVRGGTAVDTAVFATRGVRAIGPAEITQAGGASPFNTVGQGGNVLEWEETTLDLLNNSPSSARSFRGGSYILSVARLLSLNRGSITGRPIDPASEGRSLGFRVASIPEPSSIFFAMLGSVGAFVWRRRSPQNCVQLRENPNSRIGGFSE